MQEVEHSLSTPAQPRAARALIDCRIDRLHYGHFLAVRDAHLSLHANRIAAFIGPSGCGKSTLLRCLNRMNDLVRGFRIEGRVLYRGGDIYASRVDPVAVRRHIGMVFQQPNPFAKSIRENVAFGLRVHQLSGDREQRVEDALRRVALWDEVKDKLDASGLSLSGGQQQRLCIARAIATDPDVLLMDEPCSALDPIATRKIEELMVELKQYYTVAIVTHNLHQALRIADYTAFFNVDADSSDRTGRLVEYRPTQELFHSPREASTRDYILGKFG